MKYIEIFNEIVSITNNDYSGWENTKHLNNPTPYIDEIMKLEEENEITPHRFTQIVNDYLLDFNDPHMYFILNGNDKVKAKDFGFRVRRFGDALYVTETFEELRFKKGTKIISINGSSIPHLSKTRRNKIKESHHERENWNNIIRNAEWFEVEDQNQGIVSFDVKEYEKGPRSSKYTIEKIDDRTLLMTFTDFTDPNAISNLIDSFRHELDTCLNLLVDVRKNSGGMSQAFMPVLKYIFKVGEVPNSVIKKKEFNCTVQNAQLFTKRYKEIQPLIKDKEALRVVEYGMEMFNSHLGQGFVFFDFSDFIEDAKMNFTGCAYPKNIIVLSDSYCASAGEDLVELSKDSSKVTVIGRATMGVNDFSDIAAMNWNNQFSLCYPTSRVVEMTKVLPTHGKGIKPDIYIPWTPEHIFEDLDLKKALELLEIQT